MPRSGRRRWGSPVILTAAAGCLCCITSSAPPLPKLPSPPLPCSPSRALPKAFILPQPAVGVAEALSLLPPGSSLLPDLILLDVTMPGGGGPSGLEVCREIRRRFPSAFIPVIVVSARGGPDDVAAGLEGGADDYVTKPFHRLELLSRMRVQLRSRCGGGCDMGRAGRRAHRCTALTRYCHRTGGVAPLPRSTCILSPHTCGTYAHAASVQPLQPVCCHHIIGTVSTSCFEYRYV